MSQLAPKACIVHTVLTLTPTIQWWPLQIHLLIICFCYRHSRLLVAACFSCQTPHPLWANLNVATWDLLLYHASHTAAKWSRMVYCISGNDDAP